MSARGDDTIWWAPLDARGTIVRLAGLEVVLLHRCASAVVPAPTVREALDPMALGLCRYCRERLPVTNPEGEPA